MVMLCLAFLYTFAAIFLKNKHNMKHPDYDWMLFGCHPISDIAMAYCPCEHATSSTRAFRRLLRLYPKLYAELCKNGYTEHFTILTPLHIAAVIRELGMPCEAFFEKQKRASRENP